MTLISLCELEGLLFTMNEQKWAENLRQRVGELTEEIELVKQRVGELSDEHVLVRGELGKTQREMGVLLAC
ncbi:hypothetical protein CASFOL_032355 [Castilleja foliolosa]|uniref:Uncharacterized protein n=1 Tax=Castilleja foliolosa TaxID=1961234 RepID=A0ABD3C255_9LAMI